MQRLLTAATMCNNARILAPNGESNRWTILGDPTEAALKVVATYFMYWTNGYWGQWINLPGEGRLYQAATTMALAAVVCTQIRNVFTQRSERVSFFKLPLFNNHLLWIGIISEILLMFGITYLPFL